MKEANLFLALWLLRMIAIKNAQTDTCGRE